MEADWRICMSVRLSRHKRIKIDCHIDCDWFLNRYVGWMVDFMYMVDE